VHDRSIDTVAAGQRVAVNLTGVAVAEIERGEVLTTPASDLRPTYLIDAQLWLGEREHEHEHDLEHGARVQVHHGTREAPARVAWLGGRFYQLRLERQLVPLRRDRLVIRQIAPPDTLGGGLVLDPHPRKHGPSRELLSRLERLARGESNLEPDAPPAARTVAARADTAPELSADALVLEKRLRDARFEPPLDSELDPGDLAALRQAGRAVRVSKQLHYHPDTLTELRRLVIALADRNGGSVTLGQLRDELRTSRKFAQALLEHLDAEKVTVRRGDEHVVRRAARQESR
jgi:selenocysteine-specific elongation factor